MRILAVGDIHGCLTAFENAYVRAHNTTGKPQSAKTSTCRRRADNGTSSPPAPSTMSGPAVVGSAS